MEEIGWPEISKSMRRESRLHEELYGNLKERRKFIDCKK